MSSSAVTRATIAVRAFAKSSLTAGTSSQRSIRRAPAESPPRSQPKVTTTVAFSTSVVVGRRGRRPDHMRRDRVVRLRPGGRRSRTEPTGRREAIEILGRDKALGRAVQAYEEDVLS
jgi:hypothetical protein